VARLGLRGLANHGNDKVRNGHGLVGADVADRPLGPGNAALVDAFHGRSSPITEGSALRETAQAYRSICYLFQLIECDQPARYHKVDMGLTDIYLKKCSTP